ncbi:hypothetical protein N2603_05095 [Bradyrhizobium huanghuaihaiense]|uniref:hypothetical protein n=1 Tax=Bradyrhizobium huanghuaihaiense TaxID=990078 RepID=UPI0021AAA0A1|nr:hypothetical protein [Bradyrhizobium sp. CB3035]UWU77849.1 hypothetical protein N2603_05095 [Bradyrhizobium sp. CB3035]
MVLVRSNVFHHYRELNPDFDQLVRDSIGANKGRGQRIRWTLVRTSSIRDQNNDYYKIRAMLPDSFPGKDDVVSAIFEDLLTGALKREDVRARVKSYVAAHNRMFPTNYAKFGDSPLVSLDEVLNDDGSGTRGDNVTRGLWE